MGPRSAAIQAAPAGVALPTRKSFSPRFSDASIAKTPPSPLKRFRPKSRLHACHAAIKVNTPLDHTKWMAARRVAKTDCPMSCPPRPTCGLALIVKEIERAFHRIDSGE